MSEAGEELFKLVQSYQGRAFISDSVEEMDTEQSVEIAKASLEFTLITATILRGFIKKWDKPKQRVRSWPVYYPCPGCGKKGLHYPDRGGGYKNYRQIHCRYCYKVFDADKVEERAKQEGKWEG